MLHIFRILSFFLSFSWLTIIGAAPLPQTDYGGISFFAQTEPVCCRTNSYNLVLTYALSMSVHFQNLSVNIFRTNTHVQIAIFHLVPSLAIVSFLHYAVITITTKTPSMLELSTMVRALSILDYRSLSSLFLRNHIRKCHHYCA